MMFINIHGARYYVATEADILCLCAALEMLDRLSTRAEIFQALARRKAA